MPLSYTQIRFFIFLDKIPLLIGKKYQRTYTQNRIPAKKDNNKSFGCVSLSLMLYLVSDTKYNPFSENTRTFYKSAKTTCKKCLTLFTSCGRGRRMHMPLKTGYSMGRRYLA